MRRKFLLILTLVFVIALAGCGNADKENAPADSTPSAAVEQTTPEPSATPEISATPELTATPEPTATPTPTPVPAPEIHLKDVFEEHGMKLGTCLTTNMISNVNYSKIIRENFNSITMENAMKPDSTLSQKQSQENGYLTVYFNPDAKKMLQWAQDNNFAVRGHTIAWYSQTPEWIFHENFDSSQPYVSREEMLKRLEDCIRQLFEQLEEMGYSDLFYAYDVANEAWMENGTIRQSNWTKTIGDDYLWYAFYYADKYAPENIGLYYNDYNEQFKTQTLLNFVNTLVDENGRYLIDGIGFQAHLYTTDSLTDYFNTVDTLAATGLKIELTELDVCLGKYNAPVMATDENLRKQGQFYYDLINGLFERVDNGTLNMDALTIWGFADGLSWRKEYNPVLYNRKLEPKYSYYAVGQLKEFSGFEEE